jgi:hypothetical protein
MNKPFDFGARADLFSRKSKAWPALHQRFATAARAIQYTIEELGADVLGNSLLKVAGHEFDGARIRALYDAADYPLLRGR